MQRQQQQVLQQQVQSLYSLFLLLSIIANILFRYHQYPTQRVLQHQLLTRAQ